MLAHDLGDPVMTSKDQARITIRVQRNKNCPQFDEDAYSVEIDKTQPVDEKILEVSASDRDPQVRKQDRERKELAKLTSGKTLNFES